MKKFPSEILCQLLTTLQQQKNWNSLESAISGMKFYHEQHYTRISSSNIWRISSKPQVMPSFRRAQIDWTSLWLWCFGFGFYRAFPITIHWSRPESFQILHVHHDFSKHWKNVDECILEENIRGEKHEKLPFSINLAWIDTNDVKLQLADGEMRG